MNSTATSPLTIDPWPLNSRELSNIALLLCGLKVVKSMLLKRNVVLPSPLPTPCSGRSNFFIFYPHHLYFDDTIVFSNICSNRVDDTHLRCAWRHYREWCWNYALQRHSGGPGNRIRVVKRFCSWLHHHHIDNVVSLVAMDDYY